MVHREDREGNRERKCRRLPEKDFFTRKVITRCFTFTVKHCVANVLVKIPFQTIFEERAERDLESAILIIAATSL